MIVFTQQICEYSPRLARRTRNSPHGRALLLYVLLLLYVHPLCDNTGGGSCWQQVRDISLLAQTRLATS